MSTRRGEMVTLGELVQAIGVDAARFFLVMRSHDQTLDLDIDLARRKIGRGGVLILETVNPLSVFALVQIFYLDSTHRQPVHPQALKFLLEDAGFEEVEIKFSAPLEAERLRDLPPADDRAALLNENIDRLNALLFAPAQYAAIARRS